MKQVLSNNTLAELLASAVREPQASPCDCSLSGCAGWESISESTWPKERMRCCATLRDAEAEEPTFEEYHPRGTRYDSPDAPVSVAYFPYNRSDLWRCERCHDFMLRYTEFGGYYVDHRVRRLAPHLIE